jgi:hypothetical protein
MTDKLKSYIERHTKWLDEDLRRLIFQADLHNVKKELLVILEEANIRIPRLALTKAELLQVFENAQEIWKHRNRHVEIIIKNESVRWHFKDSDIYEYSTLSNIINNLEEAYVPRSLIESDPDIIQDYFTEVCTISPTLDIKYFGDNL